MIRMWSIWGSSFKIWSRTRRLTILHLLVRIPRFPNRTEFPDPAKQCGRSLAESPLLVLFTLEVYLLQNCICSIGRQRELRYASRSPATAGKSLLKSADGPRSLISATSEAKSGSIGMAGGNGPPGNQAACISGSTAFLQARPRTAGSGGGEPSLLGENPPDAGRPKQPQRRRYITSLLSSTRASFDHTTPTPKSRIIIASEGLTSPPTPYQTTMRLREARQRSRIGPDTSQHSSSTPVVHRPSSTSPAVPPGCNR